MNEESLGDTESISEISFDERSIELEVELDQPYQGELRYRHSIDISTHSSVSSITFENSSVGNQNVKSSLWPSISLWPKLQAKSLKPKIHSKRKQIVRPMSSYLAKAPFELIQLPSGCVVHCRIFGSKSDLPTIVCLHGISYGLDTWENVGNFLQSYNRQVLAFDFYGRGFSDSIIGGNDASVYVCQITQIIDSLGDRINGQTIDIMGSSFGAVIASEFCNVYPNRVNKLVYFSPSGFNYEETPFFRFCRSVWTTPVVDGMLHVAGISRKYLEFLIKKSHGDPHCSSLEREIASLHESIDNHPGYLASTMGDSCLIYEPTNLERIFKRVAYNPPIGGILAIWGTEDHYCPFKNAPLFLEMFSDSATLVPVQGCWHGELLGCNNYGWECTTRALSFFFELQAAAATQQ